MSNADWKLIGAIGARLEPIRARLETHWSSIGATV